MYTGKFFSIMGDSISTLEGYIPSGFACFYDRSNQFETGIHCSRDTWWGSVLAHFQGKLLVNNSWSGSYVTRPRGCQIPSYGCSDERTGGLGDGERVPDHIFVFIGTNDRGACFPLQSNDKQDMTVIENAYAAMLDKLKENYPQAEIWCFTFPKTTCSVEPDFVFPTTQLGIPMESYGQLICQVAAEKGCHGIDLYHCDGFCDTIDRLHPNYAGMQWIAQNVIAAMEENSK